MGKAWPPRRLRKSSHLSWVLRGMGAGLGREWSVGTWAGASRQGAVACCFVSCVGDQSMSSDKGPGRLWTVSRSPDVPVGSAGPSRVSTA